MTLIRKYLKGEEGSALTEGAIIIPVLILLVYFSSAMTDVMVLKIKSQEAARFALWETTVFRSPAAISSDVSTRFADLKSPTNAPHNGSTGLVMYPKAADLGWSTTINTAYEKVALNGNVSLPQTGNGWIEDAANTVLNLLSSSVDGAVTREKFDVYGSASATVSLTHATHAGSIIMNGGDFAGHNGSGQDLGAPPLLANLSFNTPLNGERPLRLVYDSWKAWPKPAMYTTDGANGNLADPSVSPSQTYPVVESMVSQQVNQIAFFGLNRLGFFNDINNALGKILSGGISQAILGGDLPTLFTTAPMDHDLNNVSNFSMPVNHTSAMGPITILPVASPDVSWAPGAGLYTNRMGDKGSSGTGVTTNDDYQGVGAGADQSRYTLPYRVNTKYWTANGGTPGSTIGSSVSNPAATLTTTNKYVQAYTCRGHYFGGATTGQITDPTKRYKLTCTY